MNHKEQKQLEINRIQEEIREIITKSPSTLTLENDDYDFMMFYTRENGDVGEGVHGDIDLEEAQKVEAIISNKYAGKLVTDIENVDEWIHLNISFV